MVRLNDGELLDSEAALKQALVECGCDAESIGRCLTCAREGRLGDEERLLARQRRALMDELHAAQRKVDRLDYIVCAIRRKGRAKAGEPK